MTPNQTAVIKGYRNIVNFWLHSEDLTDKKSLTVTTRNELTRMRDEGIIGQGDDIILYEILQDLLDIAVHLD